MDRTGPVVHQGLIVIGPAQVIGPAGPVGPVGPVEWWTVETRVGFVRASWFIEIVGLVGPVNDRFQLVSLSLPSYHRRPFSSLPFLIIARRCYFIRINYYHCYSSIPTK